MLKKNDIPQKILDLKMKSNEPNKKIKIQKLQQEFDDHYGGRRAEQMQVNYIVTGISFIGLIVSVILIAIFSS